MISAFEREEMLRRAAQAKTTEEMERSLEDMQALRRQNPRDHEAGDVGQMLEMFLSGERFKQKEQAK